MNAFVFRGPLAEVRWGYYRAAVLESWEIQGRTVTARVKSSDAFRLSQRPVAFVVPREKGQSWIWPITSLQIAGQTLTASLGSPEG